MCHTYQHKNLTMLSLGRAVSSLSSSQINLNWQLSKWDISDFHCKTNRLYRGLRFTTRHFLQPPNPSPIPVRCAPTSREWNVLLTLSCDFCSPCIRIFAILWRAINSCQTRTSADRHHLTVSLAHLCTHWGHIFFLSFPPKFYLIAGSFLHC